MKTYQIVDFNRMCIVAEIREYTAWRALAQYCGIGAVIEQGADDTASTTFDGTEYGATVKEC